MKSLMLLAAAVALAGCHNRSDEQAGAAPDRGDTTAVTHQIDPERTGPPGTAGRPGGSEVNVDSIGVDSAAVRTDTTATVPTAAPQDTLGPRSTADSASVGATIDSTSLGDSTFADSSSAR